MVARIVDADEQIDRRAVLQDNLPAGHRRVVRWHVEDSERLGSLDGCRQWRTWPRRFSLPPISCSSSPNRLESMVRAFPSTVAVPFDDNSR
jgi:hypothetical protein